jgi:phenylpyruvate tautomerase PptA (4-oxalocrotonate tautomerase family)
MNRFFFLAAVALLCPFSLSCHAQAPSAPVAPAAPAAPAGHDHHGGVSATASAGRKMELIEGLTSADFLRLGSKPNSVDVLIIAVFNDENYGMNFNGYAKGAAVYTIPKGWQVNVTYINPSPVPHSVLVIEKDSVKKLQVAEPYFKGAAVPEHLKGLAYGKSSFSFVAEEAGEFAFACGFPAHTMNGHWIGLEISDEAKAPTLKLGAAEAKPAGPAKSK